MTPRFPIHKDIPSNYDTIEVLSITFNDNGYMWITYKATCNTWSPRPLPIIWKEEFVAHDGEIKFIEIIDAIYTPPQNIPENIQFPGNT